MYPARAAFTALAIQHQIPEEAKRKALVRSTKRERPLAGREKKRNSQSGVPCGRSPLAKSRSRSKAAPHFNETSRARQTDCESPSSHTTRCCAPKPSSAQAFPPCAPRARSAPRAEFQRACLAHCYRGRCVKLGVERGWNDSSNVGIDHGTLEVAVTTYSR